MKFEKAVAKIEKALDVKLVKNDWNRKWSAVVNGYEISLTPNGYDGAASSLRVRSVDDHDDLQMDHHAGYYVDNVSQLISAVTPFVPKFAVKDLVTFSLKKRTIRQGLAGNIGLVLEVNGSSYKVLVGDVVHGYVLEQDMRKAK